MLAYEATTKEITVTAKPLYLDDRSSFMEMHFVFGYFINIENDGAGEVQLLARHWHIVEDTGRVQDVAGEGVIGLQPVLKPGDVHRYSSYCVLESFTGHMEGTFLMQDARGKRFRVTIPRFYLNASTS